MVRGPTASERLEHNKTHFPYRSWCPICVAARGLPHPHRAKPAEERTVPTVCYDYCFLRNQQGGTYASVLVGKDRDSKLLSAHVVPSKGSEHHWVVLQTARDILKCGHHGSVTLRCDQEPALTDLMTEVAKTRSPAPTIFEHSGVEDSQANGMIERKEFEVLKNCFVH